MLHSRTLSRAFTLLAVLLLVVTAAACGADDADVQSDPEGALRDAIEALGEWDGIALALSLQADETARASMREEMSDEAIDLLLGSSVGVLATSNDDAGAAAFDVTIDGTQVAVAQFHEDYDLYLRIDLDAIMRLVDDPEIEAEVNAMLAEADQFGLGDAADGLQQGGWVHLAGFEQMMNMFGGMAGVSPPDEQDEEEAERLAEEISARTLAFVDRDVAVTYVGSDDAGERVRATTDGASLRAYLSELTRVFAGSDFLEGFDQGMVEEGFSEIPSDAEVSLDVWIDGGELSQIAVDLAAYADDLDGEVQVVVAMEEHTGGIDEPTDVTTVDLFQIFGQFMAGMGDGFGEDPLDGFEDDGSDEEGFEDDGFEDDGFEDDGFEDDEFDMELSDEELSALLDEIAADGECLTDEDLEIIEMFFGPDATAGVEDLIAQGEVERC